MKTYGNLPALVTDNILLIAFNNAGDNIKKWRNALPLLSVCHNWRIHGKHLLYCYAVIVVADPSLPMVDIDKKSDFSGDEDDAYYEGSALMFANPVGNAVALGDRGSIHVYSNIKLIEKLGLDSMVKQLLFGERRFHNCVNQVDSLKYFIPFLHALVDGWPNEIRLTKPFAEWHELERMGTESSDSMKEQCHAATFKVVDILINKYPNVSCISAAMAEPHEFMQKLTLDLAVGYDKQLTQFVCNMPTTYPYTLTAPNLVVLDLRLSCGIDQNLPTVCLGSLQKINLSLDNMPFSWDMFRIGNEPKPIIFNNLKVLLITGMNQVLYFEVWKVAEGFSLEFPKLERLFLTDTSLTKKEAQAMLGRGLKHIYFDGSIIAAAQLGKQPLGNLDSLDLVWRQETYRFEADDFVTLAKEIFHKTDGIERVHFDIRSAFQTLNMDGIDWPFLTHLSLEFMIPFKDLLVMLPKMPNLVQLDMDTSYFSVKKANESIKFIRNLKKYYPTPSSSKIKIICLTHKHATFGSKSHFLLPVDRAVENLKWHLLQLKNIINKGFPVLRRS